MSSTYREFGVDLARRIQRQHVDPYGRACVSSGIAEDLNHQIRDSVHDLGLLKEIRSRRYKAVDPHNAPDTIKIAVKLLLEQCKHIQADDAGSSVAVLKRQLRIQASLESKLLAPEANLPGDIDHRSLDQRRHIIGDWCGAALGQHDIELG